MTYQFGSLDASLAAAIGDDAVLIAELRESLITTARDHANQLSRARCDANWLAATHRLHGLAASYGAQQLMVAAERALDSVPGDPVVLRKLHRAIDAL